MARPSSKTHSSDKELPIAGKKRSFQAAICSTSFSSPARKRVSGSKPQPGDLIIDLSNAGAGERQSLLESILARVHHLFKGNSGESSSSPAIFVVNDEPLEVEITAASRVVEQETVAVLDEFDPYLFIKQLPELSQVVEPCRKFLLPRRTRRCPPVALVLDLDETLVHSSMEFCPNADFSFPLHANFQHHTVYVRRRPHLQMFLERVVELFEIIVFTASQSVYAEQLLNILDPKRKLFRHRMFRDSCVVVHGNYLKDLSVLGRDMSKIVIVDNSPQAFGFQVDNGIPIESWFDDQTDCALATLLPFLESLAHAEDVRPIIAKTYKLRQKIRAAGKP